MIKHILVGVDGSDVSRKAVRFALGLQRMTHAKVTLVSVLEPFPLATVEPLNITRAQVYEMQLQGARAVLQNLAAEFPADKVEQVIETGSAADVLCAQAEERNADMVVLGRRGLSTVERWLVGSVTERVIRHCKRPVTVVH
ncbi:MAG: universal stress protein [Myxococcota bacterium]